MLMSVYIHVFIYTYFELILFQRNKYWFRIDNKFHRLISQYIISYSIFIGNFILILRGPFISLLKFPQSIPSKINNRDRQTRYQLLRTIISQGAISKARDGFLSFHPYYQKNIDCFEHLYSLMGGLKIVCLQSLFRYNFHNGTFV